MRQRIRELDAMIAACEARLAKARADVLREEAEVSRLREIRLSLPVPASITSSMPDERDQETGPQSG